MLINESIECHSIQTNYDLSVLESLRSEIRSQMKPEISRFYPKYSYSLLRAFLFFFFLNQNKPTFFSYFSMETYMYIVGSL